MDMVTAYLASRSYHACDEWIAGCVDFWRAEHEGQQYSNSDMFNFVAQQWELADLREISSGCLPPNLAGQMKVTLRGKYSVQVESVIDIAQASYAQLQKIRKVDLENVKVTEKTAEAWQPKPTRMLQLALCDGVQDVKAIEYRPMPKLNRTLIPGFKVVIVGPVDCRRGVILLQEHNLQLLGGEVDSLIIPNAVENILARRLDLPENPDPYSSLQEPPPMTNGMPNGMRNCAPVTLNPAQNGVMDGNRQSSDFPDEDELLDLEMDAQLSALEEQYQQAQPQQQQPRMCLPPRGNISSQQRPSLPQQHPMHPTSSAMGVSAPIRSNQQMSMRPTVCTPPRPQGCSLREQRPQNGHHSSQSHRAEDWPPGNIELDDWTAMERQYEEEIADLDMETLELQCNDNYRFTSVTSAPISAARAQAPANVQTKSRQQKQTTTKLQQSSVDAGENRGRTFQPPAQTSAGMSYTATQEDFLNTDDDIFCDVSLEEDVEMSESVMESRSDKPLTSKSGFTVQKQTSLSKLTVTQSHERRPFISNPDTEFLPDVSRHEESFSTKVSAHSHQGKSESPTCPREELSSEQDIQEETASVKSTATVSSTKSVQVGEPTDVRDTSIKISPHPFVYLSQVVSAPIDAPRTVVIKGFLLTLLTGLRMEGSSWKLKACVCDGSAMLDVNFSSDVLEKVIGFSANEMLAMKREMMTNPLLKERTTKALQNSQQLLINLNCLMHVHWASDEEPCVVDIEHVTEEHKQELVQRLAGISNV